MPYFKIEKSGCIAHHKGLLQMRYDIFIQDGDYGYSEEYAGRPVCIHIVYFEPTVTDEEILFVGELAMDMTYKNWIKGDIRFNKNMAFTFKPVLKEASEIRAAEVRKTDFTNIETIAEYSIKA